MVGIKWLLLVVLLLRVVRVLVVRCRILITYATRSRRWRLAFIARRAALIAGRRTRRSRVAVVHKGLVLHHLHGDNIGGECCIAAWAGVASIATGCGRGTLGISGVASGIWHRWRWDNVVAIVSGLVGGWDLVGLTQQVKDTVAHLFFCY